MTKKEFKWDSEELIKEIVEGKTKVEVKRCKLKEVEYIAITKWAMSGEGWAYPKALTFKVDVWSDILAEFADFVNK